MPTLSTVKSRGLGASSIEEVNEVRWLHEQTTCCRVVFAAGVQPTLSHNCLVAFQKLQ